MLATKIYILKRYCFVHCKAKLWISLVCVGLFNTACIDEFTPKLKNTTPLFVIDGSVIKGREVQKVIVSQSTSYNNPEFLPVSECSVKVVDDLGNEFYFTENANGVYESKVSNELLHIGRKYQVVVNTPANGEYRSGFEEMLSSSPIDSLYYAIENQLDAEGRLIEGLQFYADLKANNEATKNYLYKLEETWEILTTYRIDGYWIKGEMAEPLYYPISDSINLCWATRELETAYTTSTKNLTINEKKKIPLINLPETSSKLNLKYSLLVKQYSLGDSAYLFHYINYNNSDGGGSLYQTQPSQTISNIKNIENASEVVLGYFWASTYTEMRIFFTGPLSIPHNDCQFFECTGDCKIIPHMIGTGRDVVYLVALEFSGVDTVLYWGFPKHQICIDCTAEGGTTIKPEFWQ